MRELIKNSFKLIIALVTLMVVMGNTQVAWASERADGPTGSLSWQFDPGNYEPNSQVEAEGASKLAEIGNLIISFLQIIGTISSVLVLIFLGIKYMMGSLEERAQYKQSMLPYLIGAFMIFGISNLLAIIVNIAEIFPTE